MTAAAPASASSIFDCRVADAVPFLRPHRRRPLLCRRGPPGAPADGQPPRARRVAPPVSGRDVAGGRARRADPAPPPPRRRTPAGGAAVAATSGSWASPRRRLGAGRHSAEGGRYGVPALPMPRTRHSAAGATRRAGGAGAVSTRPRPVRGSCRRRHRGRPPVACVVLSCRWRAGVPTVGSLPPPPGGLASVGVAPPRPTPPTPPPSATRSSRWPWRRCRRAPAAARGWRWPRQGSSELEPLQDEYGDAAVGGGPTDLGG